MAGVTPPCTSSNHGASCHDGCVGLLEAYISRCCVCRKSNVFLMNKVDSIERYMNRKPSAFVISPKEPQVTSTMTEFSGVRTPTVRRVQQDTTKGLFSLPKELRNYIYFLMLGPPPRSQIGSTKVLTLCSTTYEEAIMYLKPCVPLFQLGQGRRSLIRDPKANGKPNTFKSKTRTSDCYQYQRFTELELVRAPNIQLVFGQGSEHEPNTATAKLVKDVQLIIHMIEKSTHLETLHAFIRDEDWDSKPTTLHADFVAAIRRMVLACMHKKVRLIVQGEGLIATSNSLMVILRNIAHVHGINIPIAQPGVLPCEDHDMEFNGMSLDFYTSNIPYRPSFGLFYQSSSFWQRKNASTSIDPMYQHTGFYHPHQVDKPYELVPECRQCLTPFASYADLDKHLNENPKHVMPFRKKRWNPVSPLARRGGGRVCWTCAYECVSLNGLEKHMNKMKHWRHGIVPRYVEDNKWFDKYWRKHLDKYGWM